ncbi:MAG: hypothetical protein U0640_06405 [Phycisphaerales bacterium]
MNPLPVTENDPRFGGWQSSINLPSNPRDYECGHCGYPSYSTVCLIHTSDAGRRASIWFCSRCRRPTYFEKTEDVTYQQPLGRAGDLVEGLSGDVAVLYEELRRCPQAEAWHACVALGRTIILRIAWDKGMKVDDKKSYTSNAITWLKANGWIVKSQEPELERIKSDSDGAVHDRSLATPDQALHMVTSVNSLLDSIYGSEFRRNAVMGLRPKLPK